MIDNYKVILDEQCQEKYHIEKKYRAQLFLLWKACVEKQDWANIAFKDSKSPQE